MLALALLLLAQAAPEAPALLQAPAAVPSNVVTASLESAALGARVAYQVVLPDDYETSPRRYPVLYLLHGYSGHFGDWASRTNLVERLRGEGLIVVLPEGGNLWYVNSSKGRMEDHLLKELVPAIERGYRAIAYRSSRFVAGLSMGGYGALRLAFAHPDTFSFAGSFSGALDAPVSSEERLVRITEEVFGPQGSALRQEHDLLALVRRAKAPFPYVYLDCGTEDRLLEANRALARALSDARIPHEYRERPGTHSWDYWDQQVGEMLRVLRGLRR